jgi:hypothetical protein
MFREDVASGFCCFATLDRLPAIPEKIGTIASLRDIWLNNHPLDRTRGQAEDKDFYFHRTEPEDHAGLLASRQWASR